MLHFFCKAAKSFIFYDIFKKRETYVLFWLSQIKYSYIGLNVPFYYNTLNKFTFSVAEFKSFVMNNKAFGNLFCNSQKSFTPLRALQTRIIEAIDNFSNSTMAFAFTKKS